MMSNLRHLRPAAAFQRGDLVTLHQMPFIIVHVKSEYADLFPGDDLTTVTAMGRVLTHITKLTARVEVHIVTIEPVRSDDPAHYVAAWETPPRLAVTEHRTGWPTQFHGTEGWIPLQSMRQVARRVAARVGAEYREPVDELAVELLGVSA